MNSEGHVSEALGGPLNAVFDASAAVDAIERHKQPVALAGGFNDGRGVFLRHHIKDRRLHRKDDAIGDAHGRLDDAHHRSRRIDQEQIAGVAGSVELGDGLLNVPDALQQHRVGLIRVRLLVSSLAKAREAALRIQVAEEDAFGFRRLDAERENQGGLADAALCGDCRYRVHE